MRVECLQNRNVCISKGSAKDLYLCIKKYKKLGSETQPGFRASWFCHLLLLGASRNVPEGARHSAGASGELTEGSAAVSRCGVRPGLEKLGRETVTGRVAAGT